MAERVLPHNLEAERSVLGAAMAGDVALFDVAAGVITRPRDFYREPHQEIWKAEAALRERGSAIDYLTVVEELTAMNKLEFVGGPAYVGSLTDGMARADNVEFYAQIVRGKAMLRDLIFTTNRIQADAYLAEDTPDAIIDRAEKAVMQIGSATAAGEFVLADDWMRETWEVVEHANQHKRVVTGVPSGLPKLDLWTRGWQPSDLIYLGARPSAGKTSMALQLALEASKHTMAGLVSMEMSRRVIGMRAIALEAGIDAFRLMTGNLSDYEYKRAKYAKEAIEARRFAIDDASGMTATQLRAKVRRFASRYGLGMVFVDYMQLLHEGGDVESRNQELARISAGLKSLARELDIPVFVLSQLSRASVKESGGPQAHNLRDSGALEQDADVVLLLHRPNQHDEQKRLEDGDPAQLIIAKQRNGPTGSIKLQWIGEQMKFGEEASPAVKAPEQAAML